MATGEQVEYKLKYDAQKAVSTIWFLSAGVIVIVLIILSILGRFGQFTENVWELIFKQITPVLTLIIGVFINTAESKMGEAKVKKYSYNLCYYTTLFYFGVLFVTIIVGPSIAYIVNEEITVDKFIEMSSYWLVPILGIVTITLGMLFSEVENK